MLRNAVSSIRARSAVRRGECIKVSVESEKNGGLGASQEIDFCKYFTPRTYHDLDHLDPFWSIWKKCA